VFNFITEHLPFQSITHVKTQHNTDSTIEKCKVNKMLHGEVFCFYLLAITVNGALSVWYYKNKTKFISNIYSIL